MEKNKHPWMVRIAALALLIGGGIGLSIFIAPLGAWLGLWNFATEFWILRAANPFTGWIGLACLVIGLGLFAMAQIKKTGNEVFLFNLATGGALAAGIAWYIPTIFQAPDGQNYPPIHDVSTDLVDIPQYVAVMPLRANAPNTTVYGGSPQMTPERNAQPQLDAFPDLMSHYYDESQQALFNRALAAVDTMGWELVDAVQKEGRIEATATTFWFRFKDDVVIRLRSENGQTKVDARSLSRVGGGDVGTNAKRFRKFF